MSPHEVDNLQKRYEAVMMEMIDKLDTKYIRKIQKNFFTCALKCCEKPAKSAEVDHCIKDCEQNLVQAHTLLNNEVNLLQNRLQNCSSECINKAKDKYDLQNPESRSLAQEESFKCSEKCIDEQIFHGIPALTNRISSILEKFV